MCGRIFALVFIIIALLLAIFASVLPPEKLAPIYYITQFFNIMFPVVAVGALVKYLWSHRWKSCEKCEYKTGSVERTGSVGK